MPCPQACACSRCGRYREPRRGPPMRPWVLIRYGDSWPKALLDGRGSDTGRLISQELPRRERERATPMPRFSQRPNLLKYSNLVRASAMAGWPSSPTNPSSPRLTETWWPSISAVLCWNQGSNSGSSAYGSSSGRASGVLCSVPLNTGHQRRRAAETISSRRSLVLRCGMTSIA